MTVVHAEYSPFKITVLTALFAFLILIIAGKRLQYKGGILNK